jgi:hypothetical protein
VINNVFKKLSGVARTRPTYNKERDGIIVVRTVKDPSLNPSQEAKRLMEIKRLVVVEIFAGARGDAPWTKMTSTW